MTPNPAGAHTPLPRPLVWLTGIIAAIEIVLSLADAGYIADPSLRARAYAVGAFFSELFYGGRPVFAGQTWTMFVSHAFLHGGLLHMVMNMTILLALGRMFGDRYGANAILPIFLAGAVAGGAVFALLSDSAIPMVGASGAVFAFLGVWVAWDWKRHREAGISVRPVAMRVLGLALLNVIFYFSLGGLLAWEAHLGGFLAGLALGAHYEGRVAAAARHARAEVRRRTGR